MAYCPRCFRELPPWSVAFCPNCGIKLQEITNTSSTTEGNHATFESSSVNSTPISPTAVTPTPINPTPVNPTSINPTSISPTSINPTPINPTPINPTPINPTPIQPTSIVSKFFGTGQTIQMTKQFRLRNIINYLLLSILSFIAMALSKNFPMYDLGWIVMLMFGIFGMAGFIGIIQEILKLPLSQAFIDALNAKARPGQPLINLQKLNPFQKIIYRLQSATGSIKVIPSIALISSILAGSLSAGSIVIGGNIAIFNTTITGRWAHEMESAGPFEDLWIMNITMWQLRDGDGYLYMNVAENGNFNIEYKGDILVSGTWEKDGNTYDFLHHDPDEILMSYYEHYEIRGNNLYAEGDNQILFIKVT